jgi:hypothetical protein
LKKSTLTPSCSAGNTKWTRSLLTSYLKNLSLDRSPASLRSACGPLHLRHWLHAYFTWNPKIHHQSPGLEWKRTMRSSGGSLSATSVASALAASTSLLAEFNGLMAGVEAPPQTTDTAMRRMTHDDFPGSERDAQSVG